MKQLIYVLKITPLMAAMLFLSVFAARAHANEEENVQTAKQYLYALNIYAAQMTTNHWQHFFTETNRLDFQYSYLMALTMARQITTYRNLLSFEAEGQVVRHFRMQGNWEFNALFTARWEPFFWDKYVDTSFAFGIGPSYATYKPEVERYKDGDTSRFLVYWMMELSLNLPQFPDVALITRIHHRSGAYGVVSEKGGSNALALGLKYRF